MVDELRLCRLLHQALDTVAFLDEEAQADADIQAQRRWLDSIKYHFIDVIECCVDVGQHICAVQGWGPPTSNADRTCVSASRTLRSRWVVDCDAVPQSHVAVVLSQPHADDQTAPHSMALAAVPGAGPPPGVGRVHSHG